MGVVAAFEVVGCGEGLRDFLFDFPSSLALSVLKVERDLRGNRLPTWALWYCILDASMTRQRLGDSRGNEQ